MELILWILIAAFITIVWMDTLQQRRNTAQNGSINAHDRD